MGRMRRLPTDFVRQGVPAQQTGDFFLDSSAVHPFADRFDLGLDVELGWGPRATSTRVRSAFIRLAI